MTVSSTQPIDWFAVVAALNFLLRLPADGLAPEFKAMAE
jgi:hypothetical protein